MGEGWYDVCFKGFVWESVECQLAGLVCRLDYCAIGQSNMDGGFSCAHGLVGIIGTNVVAGSASVRNARWCRVGGWGLTHCVQSMMVYFIIIVKRNGRPCLSCFAFDAAAHHVIHLKGVSHAPTSFHTHNRA
jgi:hypothetical protein